MTFTSGGIFSRGVGGGMFGAVCMGSVFSRTERACTRGTNGCVCVSGDSVEGVGRFPGTSVMLNNFPYPNFSRTKPELISSGEGFLCLRFVHYLVRDGPGVFITRGMGKVVALKGNRIFGRVIRSFTTTKCAVCRGLLGSTRCNIPRVERQMVLINIEGSVSFRCIRPRPARKCNVSKLGRIMALHSTVNSLRSSPKSCFVNSCSAVFVSHGQGGL